MDQVFRIRFLSRLWAPICALCLFPPSVPSQADTVYLTPQQPAGSASGGPVEEFPQSRFGRPPMKIGLGVSDDYAAKAADEMENPDDDLKLNGEGSGGFRRPAGLEFGTAAETVRSAMPGAGTRLPKPSSIESTPVRMPEPVSEISATAARKGVQEVSVIAGDLGFFPKAIFVSRDVPVRMFVTGASKNTLCIMMDAFQVRKEIRSQKIEEIAFTPSVPGKYRFYCPVNGMEGTMIVKEFSSSAERETAETPASAPGPATMQGPTASSR